MRLRKRVAPLSAIGAPERSRPIVPAPQLSIDRRSFRSKMPLGNVRRNLDRIVALLTEWVGGTPSTEASRGSLYQVSSVSHESGANRTDAVTHSVSGFGPNLT